jgi:hypothetical protein
LELELLELLLLPPLLLPSVASPGKEKDAAVSAADAPAVGGGDRTLTISSRRGVRQQYWVAPVDRFFAFEALGLAAAVAAAKVKL